MYSSENHQGDLWLAEALGLYFDDFGNFLNVIYEKVCRSTWDNWESLKNGGLFMRNWILIGNSVISTLI